MLSSIFGWAHRLGRWNGDNPANGIQRFREEKRERHLNTDELSRLWQAELIANASYDPEAEFGADYLRFRCIRWLQGPSGPMRCGGKCRVNFFAPCALQIHCTRCGRTTKGKLDQGTIEMMIWLGSRAAALFFTIAAVLPLVGFYYWRWIGAVSAIPLSLAVLSIIAWIYFGYFWGYINARSYDDFVWETGKHSSWAYHKWQSERKDVTRHPPALDA
jgi:hypothetical protein